VSDEDRLTDELASLRIDRDRAGRAARPSPSGDGRSGSGLSSWLIALVLVPLLGVGGYLLMREGQGRMFPDEVELGAVTLVSPAQQDVTLVATGYVYARKKATIAPKTAGRLAKLFVDEGDQVKQDQVIAELESADAQAQLLQVRADIAAARAKIERARADVVDAETRSTREAALLQRGAGTQAAADDARTHLGSTRAQLSAAEADERAVSARLAAASVALENAKVRAPFGGTVLRKLTEVGEVIPMGSVVSGNSSGGIVSIASLDDLEVQADVAEAQFSKVREKTPAEIILDAFPDKRFRGQVSEIRRTVDRAKASVTVKVRFVDPSPGVLPDMAAKVSFLSHALDEAALRAAPKLVAPADAVVDRAGRKVLLVLEGDEGSAREVPVTVGAPMNGGMVELTAGPTTGTRVIRHPDPKMHEGSPVKEKKK
jgi:RND family efflux transporter MFP subunit